ncbi:MAG: carboxypeptidase regulatory-like domain-containing protein [Planctomycetes bacterium]|nr:carboxypeptidase regulatory-like domain-containing protein [Planctomycetota bacterium]
MKTSTNSIFSVIAGIVLCCALGLWLGCSPGETTYEIGGTVKFAGQPVSEGTVTFEETATRNTVQAQLGADGRYSLRVPPGTYRVMVEPPLVAETGVSDAGMTYKKVDNIPNKFRSSQSTTLTAKVDSAATLDFELKN